jgi:hypothetical protein
MLFCILKIFLHFHVLFGKFPSNHSSNPILSIYLFQICYWSHLWVLDLCWWIFQLQSFHLDYYNSFSFCADHMFISLNMISTGCIFLFGSVIHITTSGFHIDISVLYSWAVVTMLVSPGYHNKVPQIGDLNNRNLLYYISVF